MDPTTIAVLGLVGLLAVNQLVMRVAGLRGHRALFWGLQAVNGVTGTAILWFGLPGLDHVPAFGWLIGLLFLFRVVQNNVVRARHLRAGQGDPEAKREAVRRALERGRAASEDPPGG